jgi:hypothetical protein
LPWLNARIGHRPGHEALIAVDELRDRARLLDRQLLREEKP